MKHTLVLIPLLIFLGIVLSQCGRDAVSQNNIEQIYRDEGVPVRTELILEKEFATWLTFNASLSGVEESSAYAMVSDKIEMIHVNVGDFVSKDAVIISFPTNNPYAKYHQAKVAYQNMKTSYGRMENLFESGVISQQDRDNARTAYDVAAADWESVQQMIQVRAPIEGFVTKINIRESDNVDPGDILFTISQTHKMKSKIWATEKEIVSIREGLPAMASWNGIEIRGQVVQVDMAIDQDTQAFGVVCEFDNPDRFLKIGVIAEVRITTYSNPNAIVLERKNVMKNRDQHYVFIASDGTAMERAVILGRSQGPDVEIAEGLAAGEEIVIEGQILLEQGKKIRTVM
jgi:RND family efflux transporter MFP subunit